MVLANNKGQALIEALVVVPYFFSAMAVAGATLYGVYTRSWLDHLSYQTAQCMATYQPEVLCRWQLKKRSKKFLFGGRLGKVDLSTSRSLRSRYRTFTVSLQWTIGSALTPESSRSKRIWKWNWKLKSHASIGENLFNKRRH